MLTFPFLDAVSVPTLPASEDAERGLESLALRLRQGNEAELAGRTQAILAHPQGKALLHHIFSYSPFLTRLVLHYTTFFAECCAGNADTSFAELKRELEEGTFTSAAELMRAMRIAKSKASLLIAMADISNIWDLTQVTRAMSEMAELCVELSTRLLLTQALEKGEITLPLTKDSGHSGLFVLAVGKLGAWELNYSSDIDLIIFYESECITYSGTKSIQYFFSKLAQELVRLLQERTAEGYVFRVDLRLRPDPASTPAALSTAGALTYYETVGQNWERAALIKARPIAGDKEAGTRFLQQIAPFLWRKHLDFAAIADIQSIKRQMDAKSGAEIKLPGHNVKTGIGGIREIEFFVQIHQLIWGGRIVPLRNRGTCETLMALATAKLIAADLAHKLEQSYIFLRTVEHRLQMMEDHQTHTIPAPPEHRARLAGFLGYSDLALFEQQLLAHLHFVHENFAHSFRGQGTLGNEGGKLSFTGVENDPQTLETIRKMGYENPASVSEIIQGWHHGSRRATRTKRARELITELTPRLLKVFAATQYPDQTFIRFDEFLIKLPAGVQLFSLFYANPQLLEILAIIMGSAPAVAETLSKNPNLLDTVLTADFYREFPDKALLHTELSGLLAHAHNFEDEMEVIRRFKNEKQFQAGVHLIRHQASAAQVGWYLSDVADICLESMLARVEAVYIQKEPSLKTRGLATIALGRLGTRELTFGSDIDLVFVYDGTGAALSANPVLYNKLSQRFITALTSLTREGKLYEVDTRLRPSGMDGALAVSSAAFDKYFKESAWTFELMALTRARIITGNAGLKTQLHDIILTHLTLLRSGSELVKDILTMREKVAKEFGDNNIWDLKYVRGGLIDLDFIAQYLVLLHAHQAPDILSSSSSKVFSTLAHHHLLPPDVADALVKAHHFVSTLFVLIRLCGSGAFDEETAPIGLKTLIAESMQMERFAKVKSTLLTTLTLVKKHFANILKP